MGRKEGKEEIDYIDSRLTSILGPTYGIIIYQEQIMKIANILANYHHLRKHRVCDITTRVLALASIAFVYTKHLVKAVPNTP